MRLACLGLREGEGRTELHARLSAVASEGRVPLPVWYQQCCCCRPVETSAAAVAWYNTTVAQAQ